MDYELVQVDPGESGAGEQEGQDRLPRPRRRRQDHPSPPPQGGRHEADGSHAAALLRGAHHGQDHLQGLGPGGPRGCAQDLEALRIRRRRDHLLGGFFEREAIRGEQDRAAGYPRDA